MLQLKNQTIRKLLASTGKTSKRLESSRSEKSEHVLVRLAFEQLDLKSLVKSKSRRLTLEVIREVEAPAGDTALPAGGIGTQFNGSYIANATFGKVDHNESAVVGAAPVSEKEAKLRARYLEEDGEIFMDV